MSRQAQLGLFAVAALILLFGVFYVITDFGTRHSGYRIGVHFASAAGLPTGAQVFFSGVTVGTVDEVQLLADNSVDVILAIQNNVSIPKDSNFLIQAPLTGTPNMVIVPPVPHPLPRGYMATPLPPEAILPKRVLPIADQPIGGASPTIADLMAEGQGEVRKLDAMVSLLQEREPHLLNSLDSALTNMDDLTSQLKGTMVALSGTLNSTMKDAGSNLVAMTSTLNGTVSRNQYKIDSMLSSLNNTAIALNQSMDSLRDLAVDPHLKNNLITTTSNVRDLTANLAGITGDLRNVTGNQQTQAQLRDTMANLDATMQKANSLLGTLGGESHVYGVDAGATPYPVPTGGATLPPAFGTPAPAEPHGGDHRARLNAGVGQLVRNLFEVQTRLNYLSTQRVNGPQPLLTSDRGIQTDVNAVLLPHGPFSIIGGANDIGTNYTTWNAAVTKNSRDGLRVGGGVLYSQLGVLASYDPGKLGVETRIYDLRLPTFDVYGNLNLAKYAKLFLGERDTTRSDRRTVLGLQLNF